MRCPYLRVQSKLVALTMIFGGVGSGLSAQERPSEDALFGASGAEPTSPEPASLPPAESSATGGRLSTVGEAEKALFADTSSASSVVLSDTAAPTDPLRVGGTFYTRYLLTAEERISEAGEEVPTGFRPPESPSSFGVSLPSLMDLYLDARPNDRVRAMAIGRLQYNPAASQSSLAGSTGSAVSGGTVKVSLNQLWLRFDIGRTVFLTLGRQQIKWGTGRFWNPTDFLQAQVRDPLEPFDVRLGVPMVKVHVPWEARGWNLYAIGVLEGVSRDSQARLLGAALRGEAVFGTAELGLDAVFQGNRKPRFGLDLSAGLGPIDLYGEVALKSGHPELLWREKEEPASDAYDDQYETYDVRGWNGAGTAGLSWSRVINDNDTITLGVEYFYNSLGYEDATIYPWLIQQGDYKPLYTGRQYLGAFANILGPGKAEDVSISVSTMGNLSDGSFLSRVDCSTTLLTHLRLELYGALHWGTRGGEFHFGLDDVDLTFNGFTLSGYTIPAPLFDLGVSLRMSI